MKIAFCKMLSQFASDFMLDFRGVVGCIDGIQHESWCEVGLQIAGMNFQTRSSNEVGIAVGGTYAGIFWGNLFGGGGKSLEPDGSLGQPFPTQTGQRSGELTANYG